MSETQKILELIECVDPEDSVALDEIDERVFLFLLGDRKPRAYWNWKSCRSKDDGRVSIEDWIKRGKPHKQYTRSRDALKSIRPEGWHIFIYHFTIGFKAELSRDRASMKPILTKQIKHLPTEELAELHAIIQAREYERLEK